MQPASHEGPPIRRSLWSRRRPIHPAATSNTPMTTRGSGLLPVEGRAVEASDTEGSAPLPLPPPLPPAPDPLPPAVAPVLTALPAAVLPLIVVVLAAPGCGGGGVPLVPPQVGVGWPAWTSGGVRSPHE